MPARQWSGCCSRYSTGSDPLGRGEMSVTEIAAVLGVSPQRVGQIIDRALARMRDAAMRDEKQRESRSA